MTLAGLVLAYGILANPAGLEPSVKGLRETLLARHPAPRGIPNPGDLTFSSDAELVELDMPALQAALPRTRFYRTSFTTWHYEYPQVEVAVLAYCRDGRLFVHECLSPTYRPPSTEFLDQFRGIPTKDAAERQQLGREIGRLFREITYKGVVSEEPAASTLYKSKLFSDGIYWRMIAVEFDEKGLVEEVRLTRPSEGLAK